jgi:hypothetical protein
MNRAAGVAVEDTIGVGPFHTACPGAPATGSVAIEYCDGAVKQDGA